jgi:hypothetical protein
VDLGASGACAGPGYTLQFLSPPAAGLRDFRFYPLRFAVGYGLPPEGRIVKRAGELLSAFFNKNLVEKAQGYSDLFSSWEAITEKTGISSAASHSRIVELERAILLVEADHPGWIQILQTKQTHLLNTVIRRFPDLEIRGISFRLSRDPLSFSPDLQPGREEASPPRSVSFGPDDLDAVVSPPDISEADPGQDKPRDYFNRIEDKDFLETLKRLEKLEKRGRSRKKE